MAIADKIASIKEHLEEAYGMAQEKGATMPSQKNMVNLADTISSISGGTPTPTPTSKKRKDVNFFDHEGIIHYSYTKDEFLALSEMPPNPAKEGLTAQGWNWSLEDAKAQVNAMGKCDIGQMYCTDDNTLRIYIELFEGRLSPYLTIQCNSIFTIDWGDDTPIESKSGSGNITTLHNYAKEGNYIIKLKTSGTFTLIGNNSYGSQLLWGNISVANSSNRAYQNSIKKIELPNNITSIGSYIFYYCYSLSNITIPNNITSIGNSTFNACYSLNNVVIPNNVTSISGNAFYYCYSLSNITIPNNITSISDNAFRSCYSLSNITIPNNITSIGSNAFNYCNSLAILDLTAQIQIPTLANVNAFNNASSDLKIIVPDNLYDEWIVATNWSSSSIVSKIIKESDYRA